MLLSKNGCVREHPVRTLARQPAFDKKPFSAPPAHAAGSWAGRVGKPTMTTTGGRLFLECVIVEPLVGACLGARGGLHS
jgi:hypothetical protein